MNKRNKGFTLIELVIVLAISGILITISTNWYITSVAKANNNNNKHIDLQSGVSTSMEMIKNTLKKTVQVTLVDKKVYDPEISLNDLISRNLDNNYNYIALYKDPVSTEYTLSNIVFNQGIGRFESLPIIAQEKSDSMIKNVITYSMEFYKNDRNYKKKLEKNILNITLTGTVREVDAAGRPINPENNKTFSLTEDIHLPNINQILISKYLEGALDEITAIAYNDEIVHGEHSNKPDKMTFVFAFDNSGSMNWLMKRRGPNTSNLSRRKTAYNALNDFIEDLHQSGIQNDIKIDLYLFTYGDHTMINQPTDDKNFPYLYKLSDLEGSDVVIKGRHPRPITKRISYGPYKLGKGRTTADEDALKKYIKDVCKLDQNTWDDDIGASTNTGKALLQSLEILNQVRERDMGSSISANNKRFLILLTDGNPVGFTMQASYINELKDNGSFRQRLLGISGNHGINLLNGYLGRSEELAQKFMDFQKSRLIYNKKVYNKIRKERSQVDPEENSPIYNIRIGSSTRKIQFVRAWDTSIGQPTTVDNVNDKRYIIKETWMGNGSNKFPMEYVRLVTDPSNGNNRPTTFDMAYLIGFSGDEFDKLLLGLNGRNFQWNSDPQGRASASLDEDLLVSSPVTEGSIRAYLEKGKPNKVKTFDADSSNALKSAFDNIIQSANDIMGVFDGPNKLNP